MWSQEPCNSKYRNTHQEFCTCPNIAAKGLDSLGVKESFGSGWMPLARVPRSQFGSDLMVSLSLLLVFPFTVGLSVPVPELIDGLFESHNPFILPPAVSTSFVLSSTTWRPVKSEIQENYGGRPTVDSVGRNRSRTSFVVIVWSSICHFLSFSSYTRTVIVL